MLEVACVDAAGQCDHAVLDLDADLASVDGRIVRQPFADVFADTFVGPQIVLRPAAAKALARTLAKAAAVGVLARIAVSRLALRAAVSVGVVTAALAMVVVVAGHAAALALARTLAIAQVAAVAADVALAAAIVVAQAVIAILPVAGSRVAAIIGVRAIAIVAFVAVAALAVRRTWAGVALTHRIVRPAATGILAVQRSAVSIARNVLAAAGAAVFACCAIGAARHSARAPALVVVVLAEVDVLAAAVALLREIGAVAVVGLVTAQGITPLAPFGVAAGMVVAAIVALRVARFPAILVAIVAALALRTLHIIAATVGTRIALTVVFLHGVSPANSWSRQFWRQGSGARHVPY
jgi:hypothetical protein